MHAHEFRDFVHPVRQAAALCGMRFAEPFILHGAHRRSSAALEAAARAYQERIVQLLEELHR